MRCEAEHDKVRIGTAETVRGVRVVRRRGSLATDELHNLVLALARYVRIGENHLKRRSILRQSAIYERHLNVPPCGVSADSLVDVEA